MPDELPRPPDPVPIDFAAAVREHWNAVFQLARSLSGNLHEAEDLTQETFVRALDKLAGFAPGTNLRAWLLRIATNAFFDERRRRQRSRRQEMPEELPADEAAPEAGLETAEQAALARAAMEELTELTRLVFHLRITEDLSFKEIADLAGTTEQAARWHMRQARVKLMARLETKSPREGSHDL